MPTWLSTNEANPTFAFENKPGNVFNSNIWEMKGSSIPEWNKSLFLIQKPDREKEPIHTWS